MVEYIYASHLKLGFLSSIDLAFSDKQNQVINLGSLYAAWALLLRIITLQSVADYFVYAQRATLVNNEARKAQMVGVVWFGGSVPELPTNDPGFDPSALQRAWMFNFKIGALHLAFSRIARTSE